MQIINIIIRHRTMQVKKYDETGHESLRQDKKCAYNHIR